MHRITCQLFAQFHSKIYEIPTLPSFVIMDFSMKSPARSAVTANGCWEVRWGCTGLQSEGLVAQSQPGLSSPPGIQGAGAAHLAGARGCFKLAGVGFHSVSQPFQTSFGRSCSFRQVHFQTQHHWLGDVWTSSGISRPSIAGAPTSSPRGASLGFEDPSNPSVRTVGTATLRTATLRTSLSSALPRERRHSAGSSGPHRPSESFVHDDLDVNSSGEVAGVICSGHTSV